MESEQTDVAKPKRIEVSFFSKGYFVKAGDPYHEMSSIEPIPLSAIKNAGKMIARHNKELATIYYIELHSEIYHGTRREYSYDPAGCSEFESQFPVFPYSEIKYKMDVVASEVALLRTDIDELKKMIKSIALE